MKLDFQLEKPNMISVTTAQNSLSTAQKMKFSIKDFFSKCDQIRRRLLIWSHLLKKSLMVNFIFCAVKYVWHFRNTDNYVENCFKICESP